MQSAPVPQFPQQNAIYPGFFYQQQFPFVYNPYPNPFYSYNYLGHIGALSSSRNSELRSNDEQVEAEIPLPKPFPVSVPLIPVIQYVPAYGKNAANGWGANEIPVTVIFDENIPYTSSVHIPSTVGTKVHQHSKISEEGNKETKSEITEAPSLEKQESGNVTEEENSPKNVTEEVKLSDEAFFKEVGVYAPQFSDVPYYSLVPQQDENESISSSNQEIPVSPLGAGGSVENTRQE